MYQSVNISKPHQVPIFPWLLGSGSSKVERPSSAEAAVREIWWVATSCSLFLLRCFLANDFFFVYLVMLLDAKGVLSVTIANVKSILATDEWFDNWQRLIFQKHQQLMWWESEHLQLCPNVLVSMVQSQPATGCCKSFEHVFKALWEDESKVVNSGLMINCV